MRKTIIFALLLSSSWVLAQGKDAKDAKDQNAPLYTIDTDAQKEPAKNTALARILKSGSLRVCVRSDVPPFGYFTKNGLKGLDVDLAQEIANRLSIDYKKVLHVDWRVVAAGGRVAALKKKGCDVLVATFSHTRARARQVALSKVYLQTDKVLVAAEKVRKKAVIARVKGTTGKAKGIRAANRHFNTYQEVIYAMDNGGVDYVIADRPVALHMIRSSSRPYTISKELAKGAEKYVIGVNKANKALYTAVNKALDDLAYSGRLALLLRRWL